MKTLNNLILTGILTGSIAFNSYSQTPKNTILTYVSIQDKKNENILKVDSLKSYNLSFAVEKTNLLDLMMDEKPKKDNPEDRIKLYIIKKTKNETRVIPTILDGGYDFSRDSKQKIEKYIREFIKEEKISISDAVKYKSDEMFIEIFGEEK